MNGCMALMCRIPRLLMCFSIFYIMSEEVFQKGKRPRPRPRLRGRGGHVMLCYAYKKRYSLLLFCLLHGV